MHDKRLFCGKKTKFFFYLYNVGAYLYKAFSKVKELPTSENPKVLLCSQASLGDALLASYVVSGIRSKWPFAKIGFLCTEESAAIFELQKEIDYIHKAPCWLIRDKGPLRNIYSLLFHNLFIYPKIISKIKKIDYEISIELCPFFPNSLPLMQKAKIPRKLAFNSGGYEIWATDLIPFPSEARYLPYLYKALLIPIGVLMDEIKIELSLPEKQVIIEGKYLILHVGTSDPRKEWAISKWEIVALELEKQGYSLVFTGKGEREHHIIQSAFSKCVGVNLCNRLTLDQMAVLIKNAFTVISVDSLPIHLASLFKIPLIALYLYNETLELWLPENTSCRLLVEEICSHINKQKIHPNALYFKNINPSDVLNQFSTLFQE